MRYESENPPSDDQPDEHKVAYHLGGLIQILSDNSGYTAEEVGSAAGGGEIVNIYDADGEYLYTLTISRTAGH